MATPYNRDITKSRYFHVLKKSFTREGSKESDEKQKENSVKLRNNLWICKQHKSNSKFGFYESEIFPILRTIAFMFVFQIYPRNLDSIFYLANSQGTDAVKLCMENLQLKHLIKLYDCLFGFGFSKMFAKSISNVHREYLSIWQYFNLGVSIRKPSQSEILLIIRFWQIENIEFSSLVSKFVNK